MLNKAGGSPLAFANSCDFAEASSAKFYILDNYTVSLIITIGLVEKPRSTDTAWGSRALFFLTILSGAHLTLAEKFLSCFIDEAGDFGDFETHSP